jgi:hypothetical protein
VAVGAIEGGCGPSIVNGASGYDTANSCSSAGAVYIFTRSGTTWTKQAYLKADNAGTSDRFGTSVALSGDTVAVGAILEDGCGPSIVNGASGYDTENGCSSAGAVYIFFDTPSETGSAGDPHLTFANGGSADFRGANGAIFAFLSAPGIGANVLTESRDFGRWGGQLVHGSFITHIFLKLRSLHTGDVVRVAIVANQFNSFQVHRSDDTLTQYVNRTRLEQDGIAVLQLQSGRTSIKAAGWEVFINRRWLRKPLVGKPLVADSLEHWFLDAKYRVLDGDADDVKLFGPSTVGRIAPHGIIGQSFDGSQISVSGKHDDYGNGPEFTTSAQAEGAIEGHYKDYMLRSPFSTVFKYTRFDATNPIAARNVSLLTGDKALMNGAGGPAGSVELHGAD